MVAAFGTMAVMLGRSGLPSTKCTIDVTRFNQTPFKVDIELE